jgi:hypothetical protein
VGIGEYECEDVELTSDLTDQRNSPSVYTVGMDSAVV